MHKDKVLSAVEKQPKNVKQESLLKRSQEKLDHEQHYDVDGVTRIDGKVVVPSNSTVKKSEDKN